MAIKKRFVECECNEVYSEGRNNQLEGSVILSPWRLKDSRKRNTKSSSNGDILVALFERAVLCGKCKQELMRERRQYELTPPVSHTDEPVTSYSSREFVLQSSPLSKHAVTDDSIVIQGMAGKFGPDEPSVLADNAGP